jgi:DNA-binding response OmpR family regulator
MPYALVIETDRTYRDLLVYCLGLRGWTSKGTVEYAESMEIVEKQVVDLVIVDIRAPCMEEFKLIKSIREHNQLTPIVVLTISDRRAFCVEALVAGATDVVLKPFTLQVLEQRIAAVLERVRTSGPAVTVAGGD